MQVNQGLIRAMVRIKYRSMGEIWHLAVEEWQRGFIFQGKQLTDHVVWALLVNAATYLRAL